MQPASARALLSYVFSTSGLAIAILQDGLSEHCSPVWRADFDMFRRMKVIDPPLKEHLYQDVLAVHGKRADTGYVPGAWLPDDPHSQVGTRVMHCLVLLCAALLPDTL